MSLGEGLSYHAYTLTHQCPIFVEKEEDGGEWPVVKGSRGSDLPRVYTHTPSSSSISTKLGNLCESPNPVQKSRAAFPSGCHFGLLQI